MKTYIALLRGINVGGRGILPMKQLTALLEKLGLQDVQTYIQSGNVIFRSKEADTSGLSKRISAAIKKGHGFEPEALVLGLDEMDNALASNPFPEAEAEPKTLHLNFLASAPRNPDLTKLESIKSDRERFVIKGRVLYLHAPDGVGRSKLAANAEMLLGVAMTTRNWRTVREILAMAKERADAERVR
jgi:uncharacterized protein (DUF1697 family)